MREHDAALAAVDLENFQGDGLADEPLEAAALGLGEVDVRTRDEPSQAEVDDEAALHLVHDHGVEDRAGLLRVLDAPPGHLHVGFTLGKDEIPLVALGAQHHDVDAVAHADLRGGTRLRHLLGGDEAFGLRADVHEHALGVHADHRPFDDLPLRELRHRLGEIDLVLSHHGQHPIVDRTAYVRPTG